MLPISPVRTMMDQDIFNVPESRDFSDSREEKDMEMESRPQTATSSPGEGEYESESDEDLSSTLTSPRKKPKISKKGVNVYCRVRPMLKYELEEGSHKCVKVGEDEKGINIKGKQKEYSFMFDRVFDEYHDQDDVYKTVAEPLINDVLNGFHASIICYGQTSSGKTHTMLGPGFHYSRKESEGSKRKFTNNPVKWGLIPRFVSDIFKRIANADQSMEYYVVSSFVEIYMEKVRDLLNTKKSNLILLEDRKNNLFVTNATETPCDSWDEVMEVMKQGLRNRFVAETNQNTDSSRSHAILILTIYKRDHFESCTKQSQVYLVDLAGSEAVSKTKAANQRLNEAKKINSSLLALRKVIFALTDPQKKTKGGKKKKKYIPYRDSKLTRILRNSLGGNSISCLVMNISSSSYNQIESLSTLRFGERSQRIRNKPVENKKRSVQELEALVEQNQRRIKEQMNLIRKLQSEVQRLRKANKVKQSSGSIQKSGEAMTNGMQLSDFHSFFLCPLAKTVMKDPHIAGDGITYEKSAIERFFRNSKRNKMMSPVTGEKMRNKIVIPNLTVKTQIDYFRDIYPDIFDYIDYADLVDPNFIPDDVLFSIFEFLSAFDVIRCGKVCLQWYKVTTSNVIWKRLYNQDYGEMDSLPSGVYDFKELYWQRIKKTKSTAAPWRVQSYYSGALHLFPGGK